MKKAAEMVAAAKATIDNLAPQDVERARQEGALVVDLREPAELAEMGRIPGSVHVPRGLLEFRADPSSPYFKGEFDPGQRVILHCASGGRSALAAATLKDMGYTDVGHLDGGFTAWKDAGLPVEQ